MTYNASKKLDVDPWLGGVIMGALMTPNFISLGSKAYTETSQGSGLFAEALKFAETTCVKHPVLGTESCTVNIFGLPLQLNDYGGQVFVPLIMAAVLALVYRFWKRVFPENVQMVFVPFFSMIIMIPLTAFLLGPIGIWAGSGIGSGLSWLNRNAPHRLRHPDPDDLPVPRAARAPLAAERPDAAQPHAPRSRRS